VQASNLMPPDVQNGTDDRLPLAARLATLAVIVIPFLGLVAAIVTLWGWGFTKVDLGILVGMYVLTAFGITAGFHRLFVHRSFETYMPVKVIFAALGSMAVQGSLMNWVAQHRRHHQHSDTVDDVHSPHHQGEGILGWLRGFWHSHIGWAFVPDSTELSRYVKDLQQSPTLRLASLLFPLWVVLGLVIPAALGGLLTGTWIGVWRALLWGGFVRVFLVHHVTWSVNSVCHIWGRQTYHSDDESRDNFVFGVLAMGEGWHNTHHAFPTSARHGLLWWQFDSSYILIRTLALLGLAWNVKLPSIESQLEKQRVAGTAEGLLHQHRREVAEPSRSSR
jgi:stearoyl-CoA desaturase (delta-9 desaturase)